MHAYHLHVQIVGSNFGPKFAVDYTFAFAIASLTFVVDPFAVYGVQSQMKIVAFEPSGQDF